MCEGVRGGSVSTRDELFYSSAGRKITNMNIMIAVPLTINNAK